MDAPERKVRTPSKSEREILSDIASGRVTRATAGAMWDHLVPGALVDAVGTPLEEEEASDIRTQFLDAVEGLAELGTPHARLALSQVFVPALAERASAPLEFLVTTAREEGPEAAARLLLRKAHLFSPVHPPTAIDAYRRWIELRPRSEPARQRLERYEVSRDDHARYELGRLLHRTGDLGGAERVYRDLLALPAGVPVVRSRALEALAATMGALGRPEEERALRGQATRERQEWMDSLEAQFNEKAARARAAADAADAEMERLSDVAAEAAARGDHHSADASLLELLALQQQHGKPVEAARTIRLLAETAAAAGQLDAGADRYRVAADAYRKLGLEALLAGVLWDHANMELERGRPDEAEELLRRTLELERQLGEADSAIVTLMQLAQLEDRRGRSRSALGWLEMALDLAVESGNAENEGWVSGSLARAARKREDRRSEQSWTERSLRAYERAGNQEMLGRQLESLGRIHFRAREFEAAVAPAERARAIFEKTGDREALGGMLSLLAAIDLQRKRDASAERYLRLASAIHMELFDNRAAASSLSALGELAYRRGDLDAAREAWQKALARYSNMDMWESDDAKRIRAMLDRIR